MGNHRTTVIAASAFILAALILPLAPVPAGAQIPITRGNPGWTLQALDPFDLDAIAASLGVRAGVMIVQIEPGSRAAAAGCVQGEVVCAAAGRMVDSPAALEQTLAALSGTVELVGFVVGADGNLQVVKRILAPATAVTSSAQNPASPPLSALRQALAQSGTASSAPSPNPAQGPVSGPGLGAAPAQSGAAGKTSANDLSRTGTTYRHPVGFVFWYPASFTIREIENGIELVPSPARGAATTQPGGGAQQSEMYFVTGESAQGITSPFDQRVVSYLDNLVQTKVSPYLKRTAAPARVAMTDGEGMLMEWSAPGQSGVTVIARIYTSIMKGFGVFLGAVGDKSLVDAREADIKGMFASFAFEAGKLDQAIAGSWQLFSTREIRNEDNLNFTIDDPRRASMVSDEQTSLELFPDGSARRTSLSRTIAHGGVSGGSSTVWIDSGDQKTVKQGRWNAGNGTLFIMWQDKGMEQWQYGLVRDAGGISLKLANAGRIQFWQKR